MSVCSLSGLTLAHYYQHGWLLYMLNLLSTETNQCRCQQSYCCSTELPENYRCRKSGTFHCHLYAALDVRRPSFSGRRLNSLLHHVTSAQSLPVFCSCLQTYLFRRSFPWLFCCAREATLVIMDTLIVLTYLLTYHWLSCSRWHRCYWVGLVEFFFVDHSNSNIHLTATDTGQIIFRTKDTAG